MNISDLSLLKTLCMYEAGNRIQIQIFTENKKKTKTGVKWEQSVHLIRGKNRDANSRLIVGQQTFKDCGVKTVDVWAGGGYKGERQQSNGKTS